MSRSRLNWKLLRVLVPILEKEGWSHAQMASDWGIALATLEGHLTQETRMSPPRYIDWERFDELKAQGLSLRRISAEMGIPEATLRQSAQRREKAHQSTPQAPKLWTVHPGTPEPTEIASEEQYTQEHLSTLPDADATEVHHGTLEGHQEVMEDISQSVPDAPHISTEDASHGIPEHPSTPIVHQEVSLDDSSTVHSGVPARQESLMSTPIVHPGTPTADDWELWTIIKARWLEVEKMLADRQALLSTPLGTPGQTQKKTYVFDTRHIALIDRYAQDHRLDLKGGDLRHVSGVFSPAWLSSA